MRFKDPGKNALGHSPFGKEKLEGPKVHHDDHGITDSVPMKGKGRAVPNKWWEMRYNMHKPSENMILTEGSDFNPIQPNKRKTTQNKINREDH
jgi:hypothetical protein